MDIGRGVREKAADMVKRFDKKGSGKILNRAAAGKQLKIAAVVAVGALMFMNSITAFGEAASTKLTAVSNFFRTAGVTSDILNAQGVLHIESSELLDIAKTEIATTAAAEVPAPAEAAAAEKPAAITGYTNLGVANVDSYLNIRETPGEDGKPCGKLPQNAGCEILEDNNGWYKIRSGNVTGYVKKDFLLTGDAAWAKADEVKTMTAKVTTQTLYVREQMNTECKILTLVPIDEELEVLEEHGEWVKVVVDNDEGYVNKAYVSLGYEIPKGVALTELQESDGVSEKNVSIVEYAKQFLGNPYVWGGTSLTKGADCSGFTMGIYAEFGISLPHSSSAQSRMGTKVSASEAKPGDLFFYGSGSSVSHVAMYIGNGQVIHASTAKTGIKISNASYRTPITVRRFLN